MSDLRTIKSGVYSQRLPNTPIFDGPVEITGGVWVNCLLPNESVVSGGNIAQLIYYVEVVEIDGELTVLQDVQYVWIGRGVLGEVTDVMVLEARKSIPEGCVELDMNMWLQWQSGGEITLPRGEV